MLAGQQRSPLLPHETDFMPYGLKVMGKGCNQDICATNLIRVVVLHPCRELNFSHLSLDKLFP